MTGPLSPARADISQCVRAAILEILPGLTGTALSADRHLRDLGADSVERVEIILSVLHRLGLDEPLSSFSDLPDIDAMVDLLHQRST